MTNANHANGLDSMLCMDLHEHINVSDDVDVLRVPGGWIYILSCPDPGNPGHAVFVPEPAGSAKKCGFEGWPAYALSKKIANAPD